MYSFVLYSLVICVYMYLLQSYIIIREHKVLAPPVCI